MDTFPPSPIQNMMDLLEWVLWIKLLEIIKDGNSNTWTQVDIYRKSDSYLDLMIYFNLYYTMDS